MIANLCRCEQACEGVQGEYVNLSLLRPNCECVSPASNWRESRASGALDKREDKD